MSVDPDLYRRAMSRLATGVTIVTTPGDGRHELMTVNAAMSVSLQPTLLVVSVTDTCHWLSAVRRSKSFTVNVLAAKHEELARWCADSARHDRPEHVDNFDARITATGQLVLDDALAVIECTLSAEHRAGDHVLVLGEVTRVATDHNAPAPPLVFVNRGFTTTAATAVADTRPKLRSAAS
jgi:flavin reductase (DIM6/NTAB) family NADH-FMN oxidoreductase RutF